jgi:hypothetical protein
MKKMMILLPLILSLGCASLSPKTEDLQQSEDCKVWKDGALGSKTVVTVDGEVAMQKQTCWIMNMFGCSYTEYSYKNGSSEMKSSLGDTDKTIARLEGSRITSVSMAGITVDPIELKDGRADYSVQGPIGPKQKMVVEFSKSCTKRQAALGLVSMIAK